MRCVERSFASGRRFSFVAGTLLVLTAVGAALPASLSLAGDELVDKVLNEKVRAPWYDAEQEATVPVTLDPDDPKAPHRKSSWEVQPQVTTSGKFEWPPWVKSLLWGSTWAILGLVLAIVVFFVIRALLKRRAELPEAPPGETWDPTRVEDLPFELASRPDDFMAAARAAFDSGDLRLAVVFLFSEQLMFLDSKEWLRLAKGKTNRQYLRELSVEPELRVTMRRSVWLFESVYFGAETPSSSQVEQMWQDTIDIKQKYQQPPRILVAQA